MPNENEKTSNELDDLFTTSDSAEGDDLFSLGVGTDDASSGSEDSGSVNIEIESDPFGTSESASSDASSNDAPFEFPSAEDASSGSSPFELPPTEETPVVAPAPVEAGKKDKKSKKDKGVKKEKVAKEPKAKSAKEPKAPKAPKGPKVKRPYVVSPFPFIVLFFVLTLIVACIIVASFAICGGGAVAFLIPAGILSIIMLAVPLMLISHLRKEPVGLFDMFIAIAAISVVLSAIALLAYQAQTYGASSKVALNAPAVVASFDC